LDLKARKVPKGQRAQMERREQTAPTVHKGRKEFKDYAAANLILMEADFPQKKEQPAELKKQNAALKKQYLAGGYPTVWLLDAEGKKLSEDLGELKGGSKAYITKLTELVAKAKAK